MYMGAAWLQNKYLAGHPFDSSGGNAWLKRHYVEGFVIALWSLAIIGEMRSKWWLHEEVNRGNKKNSFQGLFSYFIS